MAAKYQVFVSSTFHDLTTERDQVIKAVLEMGHIPVGMEMFSAADEEQWQIIARHIDESDYYAVLIAHRLGSITPEGVSFTRKEYEYARSRGIPCLGFVIDDSAPWPTDRVDTAAAAVEGLESFKTLVKEKPVSFWSNAEDLHGKFSIALMKAITASPRPGWVRASDVTGPEVTAEVVRLSSENALLRAEIGAAKDAEARERADELRRTMETLRASKRRLSYRYTKTGAWNTDAEASLFKVFSKLAPDLIVEASIQAMASTLAMELRLDRGQPWDIVAFNQLRAVMADLMTLDLVMPSTRRHAVSDNDEYWSLTKYGVELLKVVRQLRLRAYSENDAPEDEGAGGGSRTDKDAEVDEGGNGAAQQASRVPTA